MTTLIEKVLESPIRSVLFLYSFLVQSLLVISKRVLLPQFPTYQSLRIQIQKAYLAAAAVHYPDLVHRLPVACSENEARPLHGNGWNGYLIPGSLTLDEHIRSSKGTEKVYVLYAHGGGYARGEARMYMPYMRRWVGCATAQGVDIIFLSIEYPLSIVAPHPAQRDSFLNAYKYLLERGISSHNIVFMGDSAGGGICINSSLQASKINLPQPAGSVLISPWLDMSGKAYEGGNLAVESDFYVMANTAVPVLAGMFVGKHIKNTDPDVNPLYRKVKEVQGLNPQLIIVGAAEFALSDSKEWAELCRKADVMHELVVGHGQLHVWALGSRFIESNLRARTDKSMIDWMVKSTSREK